MLQYLSNVHIILVLLSFNYFSAHFNIVIVSLCVLTEFYSFKRSVTDTRSGAISPLVKIVGTERTGDGWQVF
jgi:hypothetical protein